MKMACSQMVAGLVAAGMIALAAAPAPAAEAATPHWPCIQYIVGTLTSAQMCDCPDVDDVTQWRDNAEIGNLFAVLASRRVPIEEATAAIDWFAAAQPPDKRDEALM